MDKAPSDHDLLTRIDERVGNIGIRIDNHAERIGTLERFRSWMLGGLAVIGALIGWFKYGGH